MFLRNRKRAAGDVPTLLIVLLAALLMLGVYLYLTNKAQVVVKDASEEVSSWLNFANPNCDYDNDGINNPADICPCDNDLNWTSRIYYIQGTKGSECQVFRTWSYKGLRYEDDVFQCEVSGTSCPNTVLAENEKYIYYIEGLQSKKTCLDAILNLKQSIPSPGLCDGDPNDYSPTNGATRYRLSNIPDTLSGNGGNIMLVFTEKCAKRLLAMNAELDRPKFSCATPTTDCKKSLRSEETCAGNK